MSKWLRISESDYTLHATSVLVSSYVCEYGRYASYRTDYDFRWTDKLVRFFVRGVPSFIDRPPVWWRREAYYRFSMAERVEALIGLHWIVRYYHWAKWTIIWGLRVTDPNDPGAWLWKWQLW